GGTDCDDRRWDVSPAAGEHCTDGVDNNCDGNTDADDTLCASGCADQDGDGHHDATCGGDDCDDNRGDVHPGQPEQCVDEIDNDCNGRADAMDPWGCAAGCADSDGDGYPDRSCGGADCADASAETFPGATEACDGIDNDCDGAIDEGFADADGDGMADC